MASSARTWVPHLVVTRSASFQEKVELRIVTCAPTSDSRAFLASPEGMEISHSSSISCSSLRVCPFLFGRLWSWCLRCSTNQTRSIPVGENGEQRKREHREKEKKGKSEKKIIIINKNLKKGWFKQFFIRYRVNNNFSFVKNYCTILTIWRAVGISFLLTLHMWRPEIKTHLKSCWRCS